MEKLYFPKDIYYLTQGYGKNSYSHANCTAIDVSSSGISKYKKIFAPFSGYVGKVYAKKGYSYSIWLVSNEKILCADGKLYYVVMLLTHPEKIKNYHIGDTLNQGDYLFDDGKTGNATGEHLHIELAIYNDKKNINISWQTTGSNTYKLANSVDPIKYMCLKQNTIVKKTSYLKKDYSIKLEGDVICIDYPIGRYKTLANVRVRTGPGKNYSQKRVKDLSKDGQKHATSNNKNALACYRKGTIFDALEIIINDGVWAKTYSGYVNVVDGKYINSKLIN